MNGSARKIKLHRLGSIHNTELLQAVGAFIEAETRNMLLITT